MANGYIRISQRSIVFDNNIVYWKNGAKYLGEIAKAVLNEGEENEIVKYYLKSIEMRKAILIDAFVPVGVQDYYLFTDSANFINIQINNEDFSADGGGDGVSITFLLPEGKYYTCKYVEANGDIKLYDPAGDGGQIGGDPFPAIESGDAGKVLSVNNDENGVEWKTITSKKYYNHSVRLGSGDISFYMDIVTDSATSFTRDTLQQYIIDHGRRPCTGLIKDPGSPTVYAIIVSLNEVSAVGDLGYFRFGTAKFDFSNGAFAYEQLSRRNLSITDTVTEI